jgi:hypothetical protein
MKLEKKRDREMAERKGSARATIIQGTWLLLSIIVGFYLFRYLDQEGILTMRFLRSELSLPAAVPEEVIMGVLILAFVIASQFAITLGFFFGSPEGRRKAGRGDLYTTNRDLDDRG